MLQCACGHAIVCQVRHLVEGLGALSFYKSAASSTTHEVERIESCPGSGEALEFLRLYVETLKRR